MKVHKRPEKKNRNEKSVVARVPAELWEFLMTTAIKERSTMTDIVEDLLISWKAKKEKRLTTNDNKIK